MEIKKLYKSFHNAFLGVLYSIKNERNFRIHITAIFYVLFFSNLAKISSFEIVLIFVCFAQVLSAELFNTSIELLCDKETNGYNMFIKRAKDIAAAGVLVCTFFCAIIAGIIFIPKLSVIISNINTFSILLFVISIPIFYIFVFNIRRK